MVPVIINVLKRPWLKRHFFKNIKKNKKKSAELNNLPIFHSPPESSEPSSEQQALSHQVGP
jgi:hypothetical protein